MRTDVKIWNDKEQYWEMSEIIYGILALFLLQNREKAVMCRLRRLSKIISILLSSVSFAQLKIFWVAAQNFDFDAYIITVSMMIKVRWDTISVFFAFFP